MGAENLKVGGILSPHLPVVDNNGEHMNCNWYLLCTECWQTPYIVIKKHKCQASRFSLLRGEPLQHLNISSKIGVFVCVCICTHVCVCWEEDRQALLCSPSWPWIYCVKTSLTSNSQWSLCDLIAFQVLGLKAGTITRNLIFFIRGHQIP